MALRFYNQNLTVRADRVEIFLNDFLSLQTLHLQPEVVAFLTGMIPDMVCHKVQYILFSVAENVCPRVHIIKSNPQSDMDMAVDDAGHDKLPAEVGNLSFIGRKSCLVSYIDKFAVLYHKGRCLLMTQVRCEHFCISDNLICFHSFLLLCANVLSGKLAAKTF